MRPKYQGEMVAEQGLAVWHRAIAITRAPWHVRELSVGWVESRLRDHAPNATLASLAIACRGCPRVFPRADLQGFPTVCVSPRQENLL